MAEAFKKSDIQILLSTMNRQDLDFLLPIFPFSHFSNYSILIINQTTEDALLESDYPTVTVINSFKRGLSASRNLALDKAIGKLCVLADDDVVYKEDFAENILKAFNDSPDATLINFRIEKQLGMLYKKYPSGRKVRLNTFDVLSIMSIEMVINTEALKSAGLRFNENFGLGAKFKMGEEAVFIAGLLNAGKKVVIEPEVIAQHTGLSTGTKASLKERYFAQGAVYVAIGEINYHLWLAIKIMFDLKQSNISLLQVASAIRCAELGKKEYLCVTKRQLL